MDIQEVIAMALENVLETERRKKRRMEESLRAQQVALQEKGRERSMLMSKKQRILAKEARKEKLVDDFMVFIGAIENNNLENALSFDEKVMMDTIVTTMNSDGGDNGGFAGDQGGINNAPENAQNLGDEAMMTAAEGTKSDGGKGSNYGGSGGSYAGNCCK